MFTCPFNPNPSLKGGKLLLLFFRICLEKLQALGKDFPWIKPYFCPNCHSSRFWGHGFVLRYFSEISTGLWLKRFRCDDCRVVFTVRPVEYPPGFQYPWKDIRRSIADKLKGKIYRRDLPRQNQQYWLKAFQFQCRRIGNVHPTDAADLVQTSVTFRLNYRQIPWPGDPPYLPFAVTMKASGFSF